jgi:hypothetical protein
LLLPGRKPLGRRCQLLAGRISVWSQQTLVWEALLLTHRQASSRRLDGVGETFDWFSMKLGIYELSAEVEAIVKAVQNLNSEQRVELETELRLMKADESVNRQEAFRSIRGKYRFVPTSVEEFLRRKHEDLNSEKGA